MASKERPDLQADIVTENANITSIVGSTDPTEATTVVDKSNSVFYTLRSAIERGNENLFVPIQIALVELIKVAHSLEARTLALE